MKDDLNSDFLQAVKQGQTDKIAQFLKLGVDVNKRENSGLGLTPLMIAVNEKYKELIRILINYKADVNARDTAGRTVLMWAILVNNEDIIDLLIEAGANVNMKDKIGETALMVAARNGNINIVSKLIENGAEINAINNNDMTALKYAVFGSKSDSEKIVDLLTKNGAVYTIGSEVLANNQERKNRA